MHELTPSAVFCSYTLVCGALESLAFLGATLPHDNFADK